MNLYCKMLEHEPPANNFSVASAIFELCERLPECDAETVARMVLQEVECRKYRGYAKIPCPYDE